MALLHAKNAKRTVASVARLLPKRKLTFRRAFQPGYHRFRYLSVFIKGSHGWKTLSFVSSRETGPARRLDSSLFRRISHRANSDFTREGCSLRVEHSSSNIPLLLEEQEFYAVLDYSPFPGTCFVRERKRERERGIGSVAKYMQKSIDRMEFSGQLPQK